MKRTINNRKDILRALSNKVIKQEQVRISMPAARHKLTNGSANADPAPSDTSAVVHHIRSLPT